MQAPRHLHGRYIHAVELVHACVTGYHFLVVAICQVLSHTPEKGYNILNPLIFFPVGLVVITNQFAIIKQLRLYYLAVVVPTTFCLVILLYCQVF